MMDTLYKVIIMPLMRDWGIARIAFKRQTGIAKNSVRRTLLTSDTIFVGQMSFSKRLILCSLMTSAVTRYFYQRATRSKVLIRVYCSDRAVASMSATGCWCTMDVDLKQADEVKFQNEVHDTVNVARFKLTASVERTFFNCELSPPIEVNKQIWMTNMHACFRVFIWMPPWPRLHWACRLLQLYNIPSH
jgi:hypothetical protein